MKCRRSLFQRNFCQVTTWVVYCTAIHSNLSKITSHSLWPEWLDFTGGVNTRVNLIRSSIQLAAKEWSYNIMDLTKQVVFSLGVTVWIALTVLYAFVDDNSIWQDDQSSRNGIRMWSYVNYEKVSLWIYKLLKEHY